ncbi:MAG: PAS domain S-box protein [Methanoregula sp.]|uniref:PAS domain S-box protein n=1 Tax=Methanoregula sp. TaxID=2052170 RepID=UPI0025E47128|nr:PAS domain S-box protein [Methanoregula sp.]MCK9632130.1 PAS domain S-box protein [Methanoregula sp.]
MTVCRLTGFVITERMWRVSILSLSAIVIILTIWCLTHGITTIFMHLYYFPIVLLAYRYRWKGFGPATLLALVYLGLVIVFDTGQPDIILGAGYRVLVFIGVAAVIANLSGRLALEKRSAQESTEIRERYLSLAPAIILALDRNGAITYLNRKGGEILECNPEEVAGISWFDHFLPEKDRERVKEVYSQLMAGQVEPNRVVENPVLARGGTEKIIRWYNTVLHDEDGAVAGTLGFGADITEEKRAQDALQKMQQFQESVIANANVWISVLASDGSTILVWNDAAEAISGYKKSDVAGKNTIWKQLYPDKEYRRNVTGEIQRVLRKDDFLQNFETEIRCADGTKKTIVWNTRALRDERGLVTGFIAIGRDVTAQKSAEFQAGESSRFLGTMIDTLPMPIFFKDTDGKYLGCNPPFEAYIGIKRGDLTGKTVYDISPRDLADRYAAADQQLFDNPVPQQYETQVQYADGTRHDVIFYKAPFFNRDGKIAGLIGAFIDITDRKLAEEVLRESEEKFRLLFRYMTAGSALHEMMYDPAQNPVDYRILDVNPAFGRILGLKREDIIGKTSREAYHADIPPFLDAYARVVSTGKPEEFEAYFALMKKHFAISVYSPGAGKFATIFEDITERKVAEEGIRLSNVILSTQQEASPDGILIVDESGKILSFNRRFTEIWGIPSDVITSRIDERVLSFVLEKLINPEEFLARVRYLYDHREEKSREEVLLKDGRVVDRYSAPMFGENNRYFGRVWYFHDITERKSSEKTLRESEEKFRAFFTTSRDCVFITTVDGSWLDFNDAAVDLFGYKSRDDLLKIKVSQMYANPDERDAHIRYIREHGYSFEYPVDLRKKDGTIINALITTTARKDASGTVIGFQGSIRDITEQKAIQGHMQKLLRLQEEQVRIINTSPAVAFLWRAEENWPVETVSKNISYFGYSVDDFVSGRVVYSSIIHPDDLGQVSAEVESNSKDHVDDFRQIYRIFGKDGSEYWIDDFTHIRRDNEGTITHYEGLILDITDRRRAEDALALEKQRMESLLSLSLMGQKPGPEIIAEVVEDAIRLTGSTIGYLATLNEDESVMTMQYWSKSAHESCKVIDKPIVYPVEKTGLWGEAVRQRKPIVTNDYAADSLFKHGIPTGHVPLVRHMNIPVFDGDRIVAVAGVGNKGEDYNEGDVRQLQLLMQGWWQITVRKRAEEALWESREHYRALIDYSQLAIAVVDVNHKIIMVNPRFSTLFKKPVGDFVGKYCYNEFEKRATVCPHCPGVRAMVSRKPEETETEGVLDDGSRFSARNRAVPFFGPDGAVKGFVEMVEDITERKRAEEAIIQSEERYRTLAEASPDQIFINDRNGTILYANTTGLKLFGLPYDQVVGKQRKDFFPPEMVREQNDVYDKVFDSGEPVRRESKIRFGNQEHWIDTNLVPLKDTAGKVTAVLGVARDITERKRMEDVLRESRQLFSDIISFLPDPTYVIDHRGNVLAWNRALEQLSGIPAGDMLGKGDFEYSIWQYGKRRPVLIDLVQNPDQDATRMNYLNIHREGKSVMAETQVTLPSGRSAVLSLVASPLYDTTGSITGAIESMRDITRIKETEAELARLNTGLEEIVRDRTKALEDEVIVRKLAEKAIRASLDEKVLLLREIHHRVNNNLQIIISLTKLQIRTLEDPWMKQVLAEIQNRVRAMSIVHEKLYRSESLSSIDLSDYTRFLATQLFSFYGIDHRRVALQIEIGKIPLDIDTAIPLGLVMNELISNALKHAFPGSRPGTLSISGHPDGNVLAVVVKDDGVGLPAGFDWRNSESLGLRLVNSLVDQLGGTIEKGPDPGTMFIITLPSKSTGGSTT